LGEYAADTAGRLLHKVLAKPLKKDLDGKRITPYLCPPLLKKSELFNPLIDKALTKKFLQKKLKKNEKKFWPVEKRMVALPSQLKKRGA